MLGSMYNIFLSWGVGPFFYLNKIGIQSAACFCRCRRHCQRVDARKLAERGKRARLAEEKQGGRVSDAIPGKGHGSAASRWRQRGERRDGTPRPQTVCSPSRLLLLGGAGEEERCTGQGRAFALLTPCFGIPQTIVHPAETLATSCELT